MENISIPYKDTGFFSKLMTDYLEQKSSLSRLYNRFPTIENFESQIQEKSLSFPLENRKILVDSLEHQYKDIDTTSLTQEHISQLLLSNTFTITTGHQLNLFSGPLYFLYKIISVINLCKKLKSTHPDKNFVPIYWMASEDHDFEEIKYFNFKDKKISWERASGGPVGRLSTNDLDEVFEQFSKELNIGKNANELRSLFRKAYLEHETLTEASRYLVNALFGAYGLVVVDGDDKELKKMFQPYALKELKYQLTYKNVSETNKIIKEQGYKIQVNPREINLFYIADGLRERIVKEGEVYKVNNTELSFDSAEDLFAQSDKLEFVSGNALLRPLYQEVILPNLSYIGGGGELAYWMQLKSTFKAFEIPFPMLMLRNSALLVAQKQLDKIEKLGLHTRDLFLKKKGVMDKVVSSHSKIDFSFEEKKELLRKNFSDLRDIASQTDKSFIGAVNAQEVKQLKGLEKLEKRWLKAERKRMNNEVTRTEKLYLELFPKESLQERLSNFSEYYEIYGAKLISDLLETLDPLDNRFSLIFMED